MRWLAVAAVMGIVVGCAPTPAASPSAPPTAALPTSSAGAATPTVPATTVPPTTPGPPTGLGDEWERIEFPGERAEPVAAVSGDSGLVMVGRTCAGAHPGSCARTAAAWRSQDQGGTWQQATIEDSENTFLREVVYNGSYVAFGIRFERRGDEATHAVGLLWRLKRILYEALAAMPMKPR